MKRHITLATLAALSLASVPAFAQVVVRDHRGQDIYRMPRPIVTSFSPASGAVGTTVTIKGDNFVAGTKVILGDMLITPKYLSDNALAFEIPAGASDASISLDMPGSRRDLAVGSFNVLLPVYDDDDYDNDGIGHGYGNGNGYGHGKDYGHGKGNGGYKGKSWSRGSVWNKYNRAFLRLPAVRAELSLHAERTSRLNRMLRLSLGRPGMTRRIQIALSREDRRHEFKMASLKAEWGRVRYLGAM